MKRVLSLELGNTMNDLHQALLELDGFLEAHEVSPQLSYAARLTLEELATNIIKYGYDDTERHVIKVGFDPHPPARMTLDDDGHPFNPLTDAPVPTLEGPIEDRPIGGLGLHMLRAMGLTMNYQRCGDRNVLTVEFPAK